MTYVNNNTFVKAIKFIYKNIDEPIGLELIAQEVAVSVSTLKRVFLEACGISIGSFIRRLRMERAFRSLKSKEESILEIALKSGFQDASSFARAFKSNFGYSPSFARNKSNIVNELECVSLEDPEIIEIDEFKIQAITKQGLYFQAAPLAWKTLLERVGDQLLKDDFTGIFIAIGHDNPHDGKVAEDKVRFSAGISCLSIDLKLEQITIAGGGYAKFNYTGKLNNIGLAYHYIYGSWLDKSIVKIDGTKPAFMIMDKFPNDFSEQCVSIYVPIIA